MGLVSKYFDPPTIDRFGVTLRPWRLADAPALREACGDEDVMRFTTVPGAFSEEAASDWIRRQQAHAERGTAIVLAIIGPDDPSPVGMIGLYGLFRDDGTARLGYWLVHSARGRGLATAAVRALTAWGFDHLRLAEVIIDREPGNVASGKIADKLGAEQSGTHVVDHHGSQVQLIRYVIRPATG
jgi:RimJ/RimL family protein N-acetyltransferase